MDLRHREVLSISHSETDDVELYAVVGQWHDSGETRQRENGFIFMKPRATFCMKSLGKC